MEPQAVVTKRINKHKDKKGKVTINQYRIMKNLGEGGYATVKLAKARSGFYVTKT